MRPDNTTTSSSGLAVRIRLVARRTARYEFGGEHLEVLERARREQVLPGAVSERERRSVLASQHAWIGPRGVRLEQIGNLDAERAGDARQRCDARARLPRSTWLRKLSLRPGAVGNGLERCPTEVADRPEPGADVDLGGRSRGRSARNHLGAVKEI